MSSAASDLRIAHVVWGRCNPDSANGVDKSVYYLSMHQARSGAAVAVFSMTAKEPVSVPGVEVHGINPGWLSRARFRLPCGIGRLSRALMAWGPDIVHFHSLHIGPFIGAARRLHRSGIPYVVTPHGALAPGRLEEAGWSVRAYLSFVESRYLRRASFIHAAGPLDATGARSIGLANRLVTAPNGIDLDDMPRTVDSDLLRREHPQISGSRVLLFLGRLDERVKGLDLLLEGFAESRRECASLVLVGPDISGSAARLRARAENLGIAKSVHVLGPEFGDRKWSYLAGADVFVHTSRREVTPVAVMEALALGRPVLATPAANPGGAIAESGAGIVVEPTEEAIAEGLQRVLATDDAELERMGVNARVLARRFDWSSSVAALMEAYRDR